MILYNTIIIFSGIPFDLTFHSSSTGRYKTHYNLSWTLKSFVPIQKTELQYKNKVSNVLSYMNIDIIFWSQYLSSVSKKNCC